MVALSLRSVILAIDMLFTHDEILMAIAQARQDHGSYEPDDKGAVGGHKLAALTIVRK